MIIGSVLRGDECCHVLQHLRKPLFSIDNTLLCIRRLNGFRHYYNILCFRFDLIWLKCCACSYIECGHHHLEAFSHTKCYSIAPHTWKDISELLHISFQKIKFPRITENIAEAWPHQSIRTILDASPISPNNKMPINVKYGSDICIRSIWFSIKSAHICILFRQMSRWSWIRIAKHQSQILSFYFYYFWYLIQCISCSFVSISIILCCFAIHPTCVWVWWVHTMPASCTDKTDGNSRIVAVVIIAGFLYIFDFTYSIWIARYRF